jgi:hypothetical protein
MEKRILVTGDYSHRDFSGLLQGRQSLTMVPLKRIDYLDAEFDLVIVARAYPDQIDVDCVERLLARFPMVPVVALLGTWCEGESRSGKPWPGIVRVYWHQWNGRFDQFLNCLASQGFTSWHMPRTASISDRILRREPAHSISATHRKIVGVSTTTSPQFEMLKDAFRAAGISAVWIESSDNRNIPLERLDLICIDVNHMHEELVGRIDFLRRRNPQSPIIVVANFPRSNEIEFVKTLNVSQVVSKPFELADLRYAIESTMACDHQ